MTWRPFVSAAALLAASACGGHSDAAARVDSPRSQDTSPQATPNVSGRGTGDAGAAISTVVTVDPAVRGSIKVVAVEERDTAASLTVAGRVQFDEDRVSRIVVPLPGRIADLRVKIGDAVHKGQTLCAINSRDAAAAAGEYIEARRDLELAEKTAAMTDDLFQHEAASRIALQQAQNDLAKAKARVTRTEESLRLLGVDPKDDLSTFNGRLPVATPIAGILVERKVTDGQFVQADGTPIMTVADLSGVWVVGDVFERDLTSVSVGQPASITTAAYPDETFHGRVSYISDAIDPATRTAKVRVAVANPGGRLKPEMFASVALDVPSKGRVVLVPTAAVLTESGATYVYVEREAGRFQRRRVDVAPSSGGARRVVHGLAAGERVVVDGVLLLREEERQEGR